jgi:hypothetical protein
MKYELTPYYRNVPEQELLEDIKRVSIKLGKTNLTGKEYKENGKFSYSTIEKRFGNWTQALKRSGLDLTIQKNITDKELLENIEGVWLTLGRQPLEKEMKQPLSKYSEYPYRRRFGTFRKGLEAFIEYINTDNDKNNEPIIEEKIEEKEKEFKHKTKRFPSERLKVQVLMRDGNKCALCGITVTGENIHFDHIKPWKKGGETVLENLQVLCEPHNLAKATLEYSEK